MKKQFALALVILLTFEVSAQIQETATKSFSSNLTEKTSVIPGQRAAGAPTSIASIDTIWSDDFSDTLNWVYTGGADEWNIDDSLTQSLISQGFDAQLNSNSGGNFAIIDSDGSGSTGVQDAVIEYTGGTIDCSSYPAVRLIFQTYLRQYQETRQVLVSNDGGIVWDTIPVLTQFGTSTTSPNGYTEIVDISAFAGGQANVKIKFRYIGAFDWFWAIDDVRIVSAPNNELQLTDVYYNSTSDFTYTNYYRMIPLRQADSAIINFGAKFLNTGVVTQTNVKVVTSVNYGGNQLYSDTSSSITSAPNTTLFVDLQEPFYPNSGLGLYEISFVLSSDSTDANPSNNLVSSSVQVSSNQYKRDNDTINTDNWYDVNSSWEMLVKYEVYSTDTAVAVSAFFPLSIISGRGIAVGDSISYYIYKATDLETPVALYENYEVKFSDIHSWITLPIPNGELTPGNYYVGFKLNNNTSSVGSNSYLNSSTAPLTVLLRKDASSPTDPWEYTTSFTPFIRMYTKSEDACNGVNIAIVDSVSDSTTYGAVDINVTGGAPPYTYSWIGPDSFFASTQNIDALLSQGVYYVTVTDVFGCTGQDSSIVAGIVTVIEKSFEKTISLYPNPNNGNFMFTASGIEAGKYSVLVLNVVGEILYNKNVTVEGNHLELTNSRYLIPGIYFLMLSNDNGVNEVIKFVVN